MAPLPRLYFRIRENGAAVFRVGEAARDRRLELEQIAVVNVRSGEVRPHGTASLSAEETTAIAEWVAARRVQLTARQVDEARAAVEHLNRTAQWAQSKADPETLDAITDDLLLAMHDLRSVLVRKRADRAGEGGEPSD